VSGHSYRLIDTSGSEIGLVTDDRSEIREDEVVTLPSGSEAIVLEVYDDEDGREGDVTATIVVDAT
jgi:hypothetical protein